MEAVRSAPRHARLVAVTWAVALCVLGLYTWRYSLNRTTHGFIAYYAAARLLVAGDLTPLVYDDAWFGRDVQDLTGTQVLEIFGPNPPTMSMLALPVVWLGARAARTVWLVGSLIALTLASTALVRWLQRRRSDLSPVVVVLLMLSPAVFANLRTAQAYLVVFAVMTAAALWLLNGRQVLAGGLLGLMLAVKSAGAPLLLLALIRRRIWMVAAAAIACLACVLVVAAWADPGVWLAYPAYVRVFVQRPTSAVTAYQTTIGFSRHFSVPVAIPSLLIAGAAAITVWAAMTCRPELWIAGGVCLSVLALPVAEEHHAVLLGVPLVFVLGTRAGRREWLWLAPFAVLFLVPSVDTIERFTRGWSSVAAYPRLYAAWLLWGVTVREMLRDRAQSRSDR